MTEPAAKPTYTYLLIFLAACSFFLPSCGVKNYPRGKAFVYDTEVHIQGKYSTDEKKELKTELENQLHDSIVPRRKRVLFFFRTLKEPPVFDTQNISRSKVYMSAQLNSLGYYRDTINHKVRIDTVKDQMRTYIDFYVIPGKLIRIDSVWYDLLDSVPYTASIDTLQKLTEASPDLRLLKKGVPFSKPLISAELDRLTTVYRNNGFLRFSKEQLLAVWDTVGINLLRPALDFEEQFRLLEALRIRRENPRADVEIRLKPDPDTGRLKRYYVGNVRVYPDYNSDTLFYEPHFVKLERRDNSYEFVSYAQLFRPRKLIKFIYLQHGDLYRQSNYLKTQNKFNTLGAWRLVTINQFPRYGQDTVDFEIRLVPAKKYNASVNLDVSRNQGNLGVEGGLLGLGVNFNLINRNFLRSANQSALNFRYGVELATRIDSIQTQQFTLGYTIQFPRFVPRFNFVPSEWRENAKTFLNFNIGQTDRISYFRVFSLNTSMSWEASRDKVLIGVRWPNIEYNILEPRQLLKNLIATNASYKYIFNDGLIVSGLVNYTYGWGRKDHTNILRGSIEAAGLPGFIKLAANNGKLYRFLKLDAEFVQTHKIRRTALVWRLFAGIGKTMPFPSNLNNNLPDTINYYLPFFRQYYAGGPNSMRGWIVRKLGPGSTIKSFDKTQYPDRFGDMRLELNGEYRFFIANLVDYPLEGALFTDIGNVWFVRSNPDFPEGTFRPANLWKDLAVALGYGLRVDFGFLKIRADFGYKAKDPSPADPAAQNKWFYKWRPGFGDTKKGKRGAQFQLGINYPF